MIGDLSEIGGIAVVGDLHYDIKDRKEGVCYFLAGNNRRNAVFLADRVNCVDIIIKRFAAFERVGIGNDRIVHRIAHIVQIAVFLGDRGKDKSRTDIRRIVFCIIIGSDLAKVLVIVKLCLYRFRQTCRSHFVLITDIKRRLRFLRG